MKPLTTLQRTGHLQTQTTSVGAPPTTRNLALACLDLVDAPAKPMKPKFA